MKKWAAAAAIVWVVAGTLGCSKDGTNAKDVAFARCLKEKGFRMYGSFQCPHCLEQKNKFSVAAWRELDYVECGKLGEPNPVCKEAGVENYPTWVFPDKSRKTNVLSVSDLADASSCPAPQP